MKGAAITSTLGRVNHPGPQHRRNYPAAPVAVPPAGGTATGTMDFTIAAIVPA